MTAPDLPEALTIPDLETAALDAHHIEALASTALAAGSFAHGSHTAAILSVICDMAEILSWKLERLHQQERRRAPVRSV